MTDEPMELSRRKLLGGLGAIGLASAGAGLGTSALFSDEESFESNTFAAGELDLKVDWEEHYSYPQRYGFDDPAADLDVTRIEPEDDGYVGLPDPESPAVWVAEDDLPAYMDNTSIESFPDPNDDGVQEMQDGEFAYSPCRDGADLDEHFDPVGGLRTTNADTLVDGEVEPLVSLDDVKPGDFGELTLSFHLCDNPGYVWLRARGVSESENGLTGPEATVDDSPADPELAEQIRTVWWYDTDGNNVVDESVGAVDVMIAVDTSASLSDDDVGALETAANDLAADLDANADARVGGVSFGNDVNDFTALADGPVSFSGLDADGSTAMPAALDVAAAELDANARSGAETFVVLFTDGGPNYENREYSTGGYTVGGGYTGGNPGNSTVDDSELDETAAVADAIRGAHRILAVGIDDDKRPTGREAESGVPLLSTYLRDDIAGSPGDYFSSDDPGTVSGVLSAITDAIAMDEEVFHRGTLADDLAALSDGAGIPLDAGLQTSFDELSDPDDSPDRECFQPGVNHFVGFGWWLPADAGNEVQSDSVSFDFGFYTEQCRGNDGGGTSTVDDGGDDEGDGDEATATVTAQGFPSDDDGATIETVDVEFPFALSGASVDDTSWSVGPSGSEVVAIDGDTVELDYPDNSNTYTSDTFLELTVSGIAAPSGTYDVDFVFEDDDSAVDSTDQVTI
ncbi:vWA domain-containing protein [Halosimplex pelagicum]|uniref:VWA domain-containing protein n=1 Tax=Halosimplex pelagicum TaxID=869886 RepID=A0A7D5P9M6_9EURY|nr:vWA domain-containing protein [Halosimplex pelagicum]QLH81245.1 VWA domain-containing protein [Halosimplex pelagicum]